MTNNGLYIIITVVHNNGRSGKMTREANRYIQNIVKNEFDPIQDNIYAVVPEGRKDIAVVRASLESKRKDIIFLVWKTESGSLRHQELKSSSSGEPLHIDQIVVQNELAIISIDAGEGYNKRHLMEKQEIPIKELKGLKKS